jgi:hypothetical protein
MRTFSMLVSASLRVFEKPIGARHSILDTRYTHKHDQELYDRDKYPRNTLKICLLEVAIRVSLVGFNIAPSRRVNIHAIFIFQQFCLR